MDLIDDTNTPPPSTPPPSEPHIPAGFWARMVAFSIDLVLLTIPLALVEQVADWYFNSHPQAWMVITGYFFRALDGSTSDKLLVIGGLITFLLVVLLPYDLYFIFMELKWGATLGKRWLGLEVKDRQARPLTFRQCWLRQTFRHVDMLLVLPALAGMLLTPRRTRLGDAVSGTMVVKRPPDELFS